MRAIGTRKTVKDGKTQLNVRVSYELYKQVQDIAGSRNVHMEDAVTELLERALRNPPPKSDNP